MSLTMLTTGNSRNFKLTANKLQNFQKMAKQPLRRTPSNDNKQATGFWLFFKDVLNDFVENCTIPSLGGIFRSNVDVSKRCLRLCGFIASLIVFIYISSLIAHKEIHQPLLTYVSKTHYNVINIPFPEVTICNKNRFNWQRFIPAKKKFLKSQHQSKEYEDIFLEVVNAYDILEFGDFDRFVNLTKISPHKLEILNYVNFSLVAEFMAWQCHEIFSDCKWLNRNYNCCDIFFRRKSEIGICLAFNTIKSEESLKKQASDPFWPWRTHGSGVENGLRLKFHTREYLHSPWSRNAKGLLFTILEPYVWFYNTVEVDTHTRTTVPLSAILHWFDNRTRFYSDEVRQCLFEDEFDSKYYKSLQGHPYRFGNCQAECEQEYVMKYCNCSTDIFFPPGPYKACTLVDLPCLYKHNDKLQFFEQIGESDYVTNHTEDVMKCRCYSNCKALAYITNINAANMTNLEYDVNNSFIDISFYFINDYIMVYKTTVTYRWTDLMSGLGGLLGLCIGCSFLSLVEIFYFFVFHIPKQSIYYVKTHKYLRLHRKSQDIKIQLYNEIFEK